MNSIINLIGDALGWLMYFSYNFLQDYFWAILFFTFLTKIVLFPVSLMVQKNSIKMVKLQPEINFHDIGCELSGFSDIFWNEERIGSLMRKVDAVTVAAGLVHLPALAAGQLKN